MQELIEQLAQQKLEEMSGDGSIEAMLSKHIEKAIDDQIRECFMQGAKEQRPRDNHRTQTIHLI